MQVQILHALVSKHLVNNSAKAPEKGSVIMANSGEKAREISYAFPESILAE